MGNIVLLDDLTINQIAAGEVIERPASVIKEMVENSIDAGATNITVEIRNGGISFIKVTDNGKGIAQDDLEIAFERHATSKIRSAQDLDTVTSMGFRGEALASIAAISQVEMISKTANQEIGYRVVVEAGDVQEKEEAGCPTGTSITVRNLFFNTPVRYKFLKKDYTESGYIEDVITRIALVHPEVSLKLINTGKTVIQTNGNGELKTVIYSIYGKDIAEGILPLSYTYEDIHLEGVIGKPEIARSNRSHQLFFVNKRYIKDKALSAATEQAYKGMIPLGKFGFVIINIEMNPAKVDVNVHPAKLEVRFEEENKIFQAIFHSIKDTLLKADLVAKTDREEAAESIMQPKENEINHKAETNSVGLFSLHKPNEKAIEEYTTRESQIKTNANEQEKTTTFGNQTTSTLGVNHSAGIPMNTQDVLEKLKNLQLGIQKDVEENPAIKLNDAYVKMNQNKEEEKLEPKTQEPMQEVDISPEFQKAIVTEEPKAEEEDLSGLAEPTSEEVRQSQLLEAVECFSQEKGNTPEEIEQLKEKMKELQNNSYQEPEDFDEMYQKLFGKKPERLPEKPEEKSSLPKIDLQQANETLFDQVEEVQKIPYRFIGIAFNTYIIIEMNQEMYIIDQHAAHERIMYEKVKKNYYQDQTKDSQMLLLPDVITLTHKEMDIARENLSMFEQAGFSLEEFGDNTIKLTGVPTVCIDLDTKELFLETLDEINTVARTAKQEKEEKFIATVACKAAVKAHMVLEREEVEELMDQLLVLPNPFTCPHGRPTAIKMTKYDIERKFARK